MGVNADPIPSSLSTSIRPPFFLILAPLPGRSVSCRRWVINGMLVSGGGKRRMIFP